MKHWCGSAANARHPLCIGLTKDELIAQVWAGVVDEENNIQVHISGLRKVVEEDKNRKGGTAPR